LITASSTLRQVAFIVGTALADHGITAVLSGGGAATIYAPDAVQSRDLDFILDYWGALGVTDEPLTKLGFRREAGTYIHPETRFTLEFPKGPLAIGDELVTTWATLEDNGQVLNILSATDSARDRLAWFLFSRSPDYSALAQAVAVAKNNLVNLDLIRDWCHREGCLDRYEIFLSRLGDA
jgi:hypothetical protein